MSFGKVFESTFYSLAEVRYRIEVYLWDYSGSVHVVDADIPAFLPSLPKGKRHHMPIRGSGCDINLLIDNETQLDLIKTINLAPEKHVLINIDKYNGGWQPFWRLKGVPSESLVEYVDFPVPVQIFGTDGLSDLRDIPFPSDTPTNLKMIEIIAICLQQTGMSLNIVTADDWYPAGASIGVEHDPLDQVYINPYITYEKDREDIVAQLEGWPRRGTHRMYLPEDRERNRVGRRPGYGEHSDCYKILYDILINKQLEISQIEGEWWLRQRPENLKAPYNIRKYNASGTRTSHSTFNPRITLDGYDWEFKPEVMHTHALKSASISYYHGKYIEHFLNIDWTEWTVDGVQQYPTGWTWTPRTYPGDNIPGVIARNPTAVYSSRDGSQRGRNSDYAYMMASYTDVFPSEYPLTFPNNLSSLKRTYTIPEISSKIRVRITHKGVFSESGYNIDVASRSWQFIKIKIGNQYLLPGGTLTGSPFWMTLNIGEAYQTFEIDTDVLNLSDEIEFEISAPILGGGGRGLIASLVGDLSIEIIKDEDEGDEVDESVANDTIAIIDDSLNTEIFEYDEPVYHGDGPSSLHLGHMIYNDAPTEKWRTSAVNYNVPLHQLGVMHLLFMGAESGEIFKGRLIGHYLPHLVIVRGGKYLIFDGGTFEPNTDTWEGEWHEIKMTSPSLSYKEHPTDSPSALTSFGSSEQTLIRFAGALENIITNRAIAYTSATLDEGTPYTQISIDAIGKVRFFEDDTIVLINRATAKPFFLTVTQDQGESDTVLHVAEFTPDEDIISGSSIELTDDAIKASIIATAEAIDLRITAEDLDTFINLVQYRIRLNAGVFQSINWNGQIDSVDPENWTPATGPGAITNPGTAGWAASKAGDSAWNNVWVRGALINDSLFNSPVIGDGKFLTDQGEFQFRNLADTAFVPVRVGTPTLFEHAVPLGYANDTYAFKAGSAGQTFSVATPSLDTHAATKGYVDGLIGSFFIDGSLPNNRAVVTDGTGKLSVNADVTDTEIGYLNGVTSAIQTQLNGKEPSISAGTTSQYWRGDKSWQTLNAGAVGLGNVQNYGIASEAEAQTLPTPPNNKYMTPLRVQDSIAAMITGANLGSTYARVYEGISTVSGVRTLSFRRLRAGVGATVTENANDISIGLDVGTMATLSAGTGLTGDPYTPGGSNQTWQVNFSEVVRTSTNQSIAGIKTFTTAVTITGTTKAGGYFYAGTTTPSNNTRLNYDGYLFATRLYEGTTRVSLSGHTHDDRYYTESEIDMNWVVKQNSTLGSTGARVYKETSAGIAYFRRLVAGTGASITENANDISIAVDVGTMATLSAGTGLDGDPYTPGGPNQTWNIDTTVVPRLGVDNAWTGKQTITLGLNNYDALTVNRTSGHWLSLGATTDWSVISFDANAPLIIGSTTSIGSTPTTRLAISSTQVRAYNNFRCDGGYYLGSTEVLTSGGLLKNISVGTPSLDGDPIPLLYASDNFALKGGQSGQTFQCADPTSASHAVNRSFGDGRYIKQASPSTSLSFSMTHRVILEIDGAPYYVPLQEFIV
jgi:hypothetical protein